jgi:hypothetical protein
LDILPMAQNSGGPAINRHRRLVEMVGENSLLEPWASKEQIVGAKIYPPSMTGTCDRHNGLRRRTMWLGSTSSAALLLFTVSAFADSCIFSAAPPFQLRSDAVDWTMQIASGTSCTRGLKLGPITISDVKLIAPPPSGQVVIKGPAFSYTAKPDFQGQDDFALRVSGTMVRIPGVSDIKVTVSVVAK